MAFKNVHDIGWQCDRSDGRCGKARGRMTSGVPREAGGKLVRWLARIPPYLRSYIRGIVSRAVVQLMYDDAQYRMSRDLA
jgi:hypothetical protein